jgi:ribonuclease III
LGYIFLDRDLLTQALTRKAAAQEQRQKGKPCKDQEVFRTLRDAVLKAILTELLIQQGCGTRGDITQKKARLENEESANSNLKCNAANNENNSNCRRW